MAFTPLRAFLACWKRIANPAILPRDERARPERMTDAITAPMVIRASTTSS